MRFSILMITVLTFASSMLFSQSIYTVNTISTNGSGIYDISDNGSVAYRGSADGDAQIYLYKNGTTTQITHNTGGTHFIDYVQINNLDQIVWNQYDYKPTGGLDVNLYLYSGGSIAKINTLIGTSDNYCIEPRINNSGQIVWRQYDTNLGMNSGVEVFFYDGSTHRLTTDEDKQSEATLNDNGVVVWSGDLRSQSDWDTKVYRYDGNNVTLMAWQTGAACYAPQVGSDNSIVYMHYNSMNSYYYSLYLIVNGSAQKITDSTFKYTQPFSYKDGNLYIVKTDKHIYKYNSGSWTKITPDSTDDTYLNSNGSYLTWVDNNASGYGRIDVYDGSTITNLTGYGSYGYPLVDTHGNVIWNDGSWITMASKTATAIEQHPELPREYVLGQNYPNPFNPTTQIRFTLPQSGNVTLRVYDVLGKEVATLVNGSMAAGEHTIEFGAVERGLQSGVYFYRLQSGTFLKTQKMVLLK